MSNEKDSNEVMRNAENFYKKWFGIDDTDETDEDTLLSRGVIYEMMDAYCKKQYIAHMLTIATLTKDVEQLNEEIKYHKRTIDLNMVDFVKENERFKSLTHSMMIVGGNTDEEKLLWLIKEIRKS